MKLTVRNATESSSINLSRASLQWVEPDATETLAWVETTGSTSFTTRAVVGDSATVLDASEDRIMVVVDANAVAGGLDPGDEMELAMTTGFGAKTTYVATVPDSLDEKGVVEL